MLEDLSAFLEAGLNQGRDCQCVAGEHADAAVESATPQRHPSRPRESEPIRKEVDAGTGGNHLADKIAIIDRMGDPRRDPGESSGTFRELAVIAV
jgi:hypothetical protein